MTPELSQQLIISFLVVSNLVILFLCLKILTIVSQGQQMLTKALDRVAAEIKGFTKGLFVTQSKMSEAIVGMEKAVELEIQQNKNDHQEIRRELSDLLKS